MNNISSQSSTSIIPLPAKLEQQVGQFALTAQTAIITDASNTWNAAYLRNLLHKASGIPLPITIDDAPTRPLIRLIAGVEPELGKEGYRLSVSEREIKLEGSTASGVFYAIQSLRQLLSAEIESDVVFGRAKLVNALCHNRGSSPFRLAWPHAGCWSPLSRQDDYPAYT